MTQPIPYSDEAPGPVSTNHGPEDIIFLFKRGRLERLSADTVGPTEFFYGYMEMKKAGAPVDLLDETVFGVGERTSPVWTVLTLISSVLFGINAWAVFRLARGLDRFSPARTVVVVNNVYGLALAYLKMRGRLRSEVVFIAMGLIGAAPPPLARWIYARILRCVTLAVISRAEREHLAALLPEVTVHYVPFGVDHRFWTPGDAKRRDNYVLSIGNDRNRDYDTLIRAWKPEFPTLRIVTQRTVPAPLPANVEIIAGDWRTQLLSDGAVRDMVRGSRFVVVPSHDTMQPAGQSACLQAMACAKAVVLSDIAGLWDRELMRDRESCILVKPGDVAALIRALDRPIRFYNAGSGECLGDTDGAAANEMTAFRPRSPYAVAKAAATWQVANYREAYGLHACSGILFNHESPLRPERFVTRKIVAAAARIAAGGTDKLTLGNLAIHRDWGWAPEYVEAMWLMLQRDTPDDFVIATGEPHSLEEFVDAAFAHFDLSWRDHVEIDERFFRPTDIALGFGDAAKAAKILGWRAKTRMPGVATRMAQAEQC